MKFQVLILLACVSILAISCSPTTNAQGDGGGDTGSESCDDVGRRDTDGDGISDLNEGNGTVDTDRDGEPDTHDTDSDNDGIDDAVEFGMPSCDDEPRDTDEDGTPDFQDIDSDDNRILDRDEEEADSDGNGVLDSHDMDDDGDGIIDSIELGADPTDPPDTDQDGTPDYHDTDTDDDGIPDEYEGSDDMDGDGRGAWRDDDTDGDSWSDSDEYGAEDGEEPVDTDGDGTPDFRDLDSDDDDLTDEDERILGTSRLDRDTDGDGHSDYEEHFSGTDPLDFNSFPQPDPCSPDECGPVELCGELGSGDGLDNDCDDDVDETCPCTPGESRSCFVGPPSVRNQGSCSDGLQTCDEFGSWGECVGGSWPGVEVCDGSDNDCDGLYDEDLEGCESPLSCPSTQVGAPLAAFELDGRDIYSGTYDSWTWEIFCPATFTDKQCPDPEDPSARDTVVYFDASGAYRARATIIIDGSINTCQFQINVQGDGLRVELTWDTQGEGHGDTDVDLHLHRPLTTTPWFDSNDDCYYSNCKASGYRVNWEFESTPEVDGCSEAPHGHGAQWIARGNCANPRLDVDVIYCDPAVADPASGSFCAPENINVDNPELNEPFRIMVNYYSSHGHPGPTHPTVRIYCGSSVARRTLGEGDVALHPGGSGSSGESWLVADVEFVVGECGGVDCVVREIRRDEMTYWIQTGTDFGPPW